MPATVLHLHRGTPFIYQGEELGMTNASFVSIDDFRDIESINHYTAAVAAGQTSEHVLAGLRAMSRDNARTPMQWDSTRHAGFTSSTPWLAVNPNYTEINAEAAVAEQDSVFHHYRRLIELRHTEPAVAYGDFRMLLADHDRIYAFTRTFGDTQLLVLGNFSGERVDVEILEVQVWAAAELLIANYPDVAGATRELRPWEARVYRRTAGTHS